MNYDSDFTEDIKVTQDEYIEILFNDLGFNNATKHAHLKDYYGVDEIFELPKSVKSDLITYLKDQKESRRTGQSFQKKLFDPDWP